MTIDGRRRAFLKEMGIDVWERRAAPEAAVAIADDSGPAGTADRGGDGADHAGRVAAMDWDALAQAVAACRRCPLADTRSNTVFGVGDRQARWMIVGEAPGAEEDRQGEPFVGRAGRLLNSMLAAVGLERESVYIANILKCRPPDNRDPKPEEEHACRDYLERQIRLLRPRLILAVGRIAAQGLLKVDTPIGRMRGRRYEYQDLGIPVVVTYHPAYLLRSPLEKRKAWQDLIFARSICPPLGASA
jgi:DNA polymerase